MQRDRGRGAGQAVNDRAVLELLEHIARLALARETRESSATGADAPRGNGYAKAGDGRGDGVDIDAATAQDRAECRVIGIEILRQLRIAVGDERSIARIGELASHDVLLSSIRSPPYRVNAAALTGVDVDDIPSRLRRALGREESHRLGHVFRKHAALQQAALAIDRLELVGAGLVLLGALLGPFALPDTGAAQDSVRVHDIHANAGRCAFQRQASGQVQLGGLGRAVQQRRPATRPVRSWIQ